MADPRDASYAAAGAALARMLAADPRHSARQRFDSGEARPGPEDDPDTRPVDPCADDWWFDADNERALMPEDEEPQP